MQQGEVCDHGCGNADGHESGRCEAGRVDHDHRHAASNPCDVAGDGRPAWAVLSSRAVFRPDLAAGLTERYEFRVGDEVFYLGVRDGEPDNGSGPAADPIVVAEMTEETFNRVQTGELKMAQGVWTGAIRLVRGPAAALDRCEHIFGG